MAVVVRKVINPKFDNAIGNYFYGYLNILIGAVLTFCVQSSSVFTSALTPLVGIGLISVSSLLCLALQYRVFHQLADLGWVEFALGVHFLPGRTATSAISPSRSGQTVEQLKSKSTQHRSQSR